MDTISIVVNRNHSFYMIGILAGEVALSLTGPAVDLDPDHPPSDDQRSGRNEEDTMDSPKGKCDPHLLELAPEDGGI